jgi:hypothetical protein
MATPQEEQLTTDPVDAMLEQTDEAIPAAPAPAEAPETPETPAPAEETPAPEGQPPAEAPAEEVTPAVEETVPAAPSEPVEDKPPEEQVPLSVHLHKLGKTKERARTQIEIERQEKEVLRKRVQELEATQPKDVDPLEVFYADPENEGLPPSRELIKQHDEFVARETRRQVTAPTPTESDADAARRVLAAINQAPQATQILVRLADKRGYITNADIREIIHSPNPVAKALEVAKDHIEALGADDEVALVNQLFPPAPVIPPAPRVPAAPQPKAKAPAAAPARASARAPAQPKETTDEEANEPPEPPSRERDLVDFMFKFKR